MATRVLDAELVIRGRADQSSAAAVESVIKRVESAAKSVDSFRKAQERFAGARAKFNEATKAVEASARAMAAGGKPVKELEANYRAAQKAVREASKSFEAQKSVVLGAKHELESMGVAVSRLASEQARLKSEAEQATGALARQQRAQQRAQRFRSIAGGIGALGGGIIVGHAAREVASETVKATAEGEHERTRMRAAGMSEEEIREAEGISARLSGKYMSVSQTRILHLLRNARAVTGSFEEAGNIMDPLLGAYVTSMGAHPDRRQELEEDFDKLVKGEEIVGATQNIPRFVKNMDLVSKAMNVFGDTLRPSDFYDFAKYARQAGPSYGDDFLLGVAPTLMQEMGGKSAGEAMASFYGQFVGGKMSKPAAEMLAKYGLVDSSKIVYTSTGAVKGLLPGAVKDVELAKANPYQWIRQVLLPALAAHGITSKEDIENVGAVLASKRTTGQALGIFATQGTRIEKDLTMERGAMGSDASRLFQERDPFIAWRSVTEQLTNLLQAAGSPLAEPAAAALNHIAGGLNALTEAARAHPTAASGGLLASLGAAGAVAYQGIISGAAKFGILAPETAARWGLSGLAGSAATVPALVAAGGAALSYRAATMVRDNPDAFQGTVDNPVLGALSGDYALAQAIMHPPERKDEITVKVEVAPAEGFWARAWAMFRNPNGGSTTTVRSTGSVGRSMPEAGAFDNGGMPQP